MLMTLNKKGKFTLVAAAQSNPGRCGNETNRNYEYELAVSVPAEYLDANDFVFDHLLIQKYFDDTFGKEPWILSCELIVLRTIVHFYEQLKGRLVNRIDVNIIADGVNHRGLWEASIDTAPKIPAVKSPFANVGNSWLAAR